MIKRFILHVLFLISLSVLSSVQAQIPDYSLPQNWLCHPMKGTDPSRKPMQVDVILPDSSIDTTITYAHPVSNTGVDIFYIYPTIDLSLFYYNTPMAWIDTNSAKNVVRQQVGLFAQFGRLFAPYYRQVTLGTYFDTAYQQRVSLFDTAATDVAAAFQHYLDNYNNGNKIILVGHSQGGQEVLFLLRKFFDNNPALRAKLVVAIPGGATNFVQKGSDKGGMLENIPVCPPLKSGVSCGCVIGWRSMRYATVLSPVVDYDAVYDTNFVNRGLMYQTFDTLTKEEAYYDFGYDQYKTLTRYVMLNPKDSINYVGYENMYAALDVKQSVPVTEAFEVQNIQLPGDKRADPMAGLFANYHVWDFQIVQGDLLNVVRTTLNECVYSGVNDIEESDVEVFPNPAHDNVQIRMNGMNPQDIEIGLFDLMGRKVMSIGRRHNSQNNQPFTIPVGDLGAGIYCLHISGSGVNIVKKLIIEK